jgi:hypothetical protein
VYTRQPTGGPPQDVAETTHHFINLTAGNPDSTWTTADYAQVETAFTTMFTAFQGLWTPMTKALEVRWYKDGPAFKPHGSISAPIERVTPINVAGTFTSQGAMPPQLAISVTEVTQAHYNVPPHEGRPGQLRHRWGRFYLPGWDRSVAGQANTASEGRLTPANQTTIANAVQIFYNSCRGGNNLVPVMYSPTTGSSWSVDEIHVDDIWDVIRRRRFDTPLSRAVRTLDPVTGG